MAKTKRNPVPQALATKRDGVAFHLAHIPDDFPNQPSEQFDPAYMQELFDLGYQRIAGESPWLERPPHVQWAPERAAGDGERSTDEA